MRQIANRVSLSGVLMMAAIGVLATPLSAAAQSEVVLPAAKAAARAGRWAVASNAAATQGSVMRHPDSGEAKIVTARAKPSDYFEMEFNAAAGKPYRLWLLGRADDDDWGNDSVFVQFSDSVTASGESAFRIGTTSATEVNLEECRHCGLSGWQWQDNGWGKNVLGPPIYFAKTGPQTLRVQTREDGLSIDSIVLSSSTYLQAAPAAANTAASSATSAQEPEAEAEPDPEPASEPEPEPEAAATAASGAAAAAESGSSGSVVKLLDWNIHHGVGTDGKYDINRIASAIVRTGANVVSLNEVERFTGWGNEDQPARFAALLKSKTGKTWYYNFAQTSGNSKGQGNLLLTTFRIESDDDGLLNYTRSIARVAVVVNGIRVNIFSTHLDPDSGSRRAAQMRQLIGWADNYPEQRIIAGDFNAWPSLSEIGIMTAGHLDAWAVAQKAGNAIAFEGNSGNTRNTRIDYVFYSKGATRLHLTQARVWDMRDSRGVMPSDHRPVMATFTVK